MMVTGVSAGVGQSTFAKKLGEDWAFIWFICSTYYPRKKKMMDRFQLFQTLGSRKNIYILKGKKEIRLFLKDIESSRTSR